MKEFNKNLGQRIYEARIESGLSQQELAARVGVGQDAMSLYERGARTIGLENLIAVAKELNKPLNYFLEIHPALVVAADSKLSEIVLDSQAHPGEMKALIEYWEFLKWRRKMPK